MRCIKQYSATKIYLYLLLHLIHLVVEFPAILVYSIGGDGVVVEGVGWACHSSVLNMSREVFPTQMAEDVVGAAVVTPLHSPQPCKTYPNDKEKVLDSIMNLNI
jgi:hypothetical protein